MSGNGSAGLVVKIAKVNHEVATTAGARRFGYYMLMPDGTIDITVIDQLVNADVLAEFHENSSVVFNLQPIIFALDVVERNYRELVDATELHQSQLSSSMVASSRPISVVMDGFVLIVQKISNFLSSTTAFLDQTRTQLSRVHGEDSPELNAWNIKRNNLHASSFSYRFLYQLRNFAQHSSLPFSNLFIGGKRVTDNSTMLFKINAMISRDGLFGPGFTWEKKIEVEIRKQSAEIELLSFIPEYLRILRKLCMEAVQLHNVQLAVCTDYFEAVRRTLKIPMGAVPVIFVGELNSKGTPPSQFEYIPLEQFEYLLREYNRLLDASHPE